MNFYENNQEPERALLISVDTGAFDAEISLEELSELAKTAGAQVVAMLSQKLPAFHAATFVGSGRIQEIADFCAAESIDLIIADSELSPAQIHNIEALTKTRTIDRTMLILDIFAARAKSSEGKLQVELAQLKYTLPFLTGRGASLSRLGGGIGTRGPGESKLESDKRHIRRRIYNLSEELAKVEKRRTLLRARRKKDGVVSVAIVGYTNAGKSTLMNRLTDAGVLSEDKLFATLDPTARRLTLPQGQDVMLIDTVGLVRRLPHRLVDAFKSTLEEAKSADLILNVCDVSAPDCAEHLQVTADLLEELGCSHTPVISVMNKCDRVNGAATVPTLGKAVMISALTGQGIDALLTEIENSLPKTKTKATLLIPFDKGGLVAAIRRDGVIYSEEFTQAGTKITALVDVDVLETLREYLVFEA